jgi:hypothetical protein
VRIVYFFKSGIGKKLLTVETVKVQKLQVGTNSPILEVIFKALASMGKGHRSPTMGDHFSPLDHEALQ